MSADRFAPEPYEDFLCRGKTVQEVAEIQRRQKEQEAALQAERAMKEDDGKQWNEKP